jgi:hypothetical protein
MIRKIRADIDEEMAQQALALKLVVAASNFAGPNLHQYQSVAIDFCA